MSNLTLNKIALVTGGSRGLGKSTVLALAAQGVDVIFTYNSQQADAEAVVAEAEALDVKAAALQLDVGNSKRFGDFAQTLARVLEEKWQRKDFDFLVNNAGIGANAPFAEFTEEQFDLLMNIHLKGTFFLSQKLLPLIKNGGRIVNISTGLTRFTYPGYSAYASMKGAVEVLSRYMAKELGARGIAVNTVAPGAIETDFGGGRVRDNTDLNQQLASMTALGRVGVPDDIGPMIASLLSDNNRWITAQRIEVSGGMML